MGRPSRGIGRRRRALALLMPALCLGALALSLTALFLVLGNIAAAGAGALTLDLLTHTPRPVGETGGGMANAIAGTLILVAMGALVGVPIGIGAGLYLAEAGASRLAQTARFWADVLTGIPAITIGLFAYAVLVVPLRSFSALAGGLALGILMLPVVTRSAEEAIRLVPGALREAALALGAPRWRVALTIVLPAARRGIVTGALLAIARAAGETAPLLFTAFGNQYWSWDPRQPIAALPLQIFTYAISPYDDWQRQARAGALLLVGLVLLLSTGARLLTSRTESGG
ncbi:MAG: phosphate ABC transporter permease PstA [Chloroflexi bacterium]|nr:phosphate ABC transporter permease PstA [Chloroflexota bacterium]